MAYELLGKNFTPPDLRQGDRQSASTRKTSASKAWCSAAAARARCRMRGCEHRRERCARDARRATASSPPTTCRAAGAEDAILTNEPHVRRPADSRGRGRERRARGGRDREDQGRVRGAAVHRRSARRACSRAAPMRGTTATSRTPAVELQEAASGPRGDFARGQDGQLPTGEPVRRVVVRRRRRGLANAKLVLDETFVTAGISHHSMEPRSAMAYWQNGKCFVYGSSQSQSFVGPGHRAVSSASSPTNLVYVAETCGGGFGSKGGAYPIMAVPALHGEEDQPAGDDADQPRRGVFLRLGARTGFQGRIKIGFARTAA